MLVAPINPCAFVMNRLILTVCLLLFVMTSSEVFFKKNLSLPPCKIVLVRHGETDWNVAKKSQGWTDIPLNEKGRAQARTLSKEFSRLALKTIYASSLSRAAETAEIIAEPHQAEVILDPAIRFYQKDKIRVFSKNPKTREAQIDQDIVTDALAYLKKIAKQHPGEMVLVVTHQAVVNSFFRTIGKHKKKLKKLGNGKSICFQCTENAVCIDEYELEPSISDL